MMERVNQVLECNKVGDLHEPHTARNGSPRDQLTVPLRV